MWRSPLVVLDEAHHLKNPQTNAHSIFADRQETKDCLGFLDDTFDRMLFLTATPFQLGHHELINVLSIFKSIRWTGAHLPYAKDELKQRLADLESKLDEAQRLARQLDRAWGNLTDEEVKCDLQSAGYNLLGSGADHVEQWWTLVRNGQVASDRGRTLLALVSEAAECNRQAKLLLKPWIIRHLKPRYFQPAGTSSGTIENGHLLMSRRVVYPGESIDPKLQPLNESGEAVPARSGLPIEPESVLPFWLSIRAQAELARLPDSTRAYFAEGLVSSYEAFHHTVKVRAKARTEDEEAEADDSPVSSEQARISKWYTDQIQRYVPGANSGDAESAQHPKVAATVARTVDAWARGEKILIFVFYRETARALHRHISAAIEQALLDTASKRLALNGGDKQETRRMLTRLAQRLADEQSPFFRDVHELLTHEVSRAIESKPISEHDRRLLITVLLRYTRSFSFISRFFPLDDPYFRPALREHGRATTEARRSMRDAFAAVSPITGQSPMDQIRDFLSFMWENTRDSRSDGPSSEFDAYLVALKRIQMGSISGHMRKDDNYVRDEHGRRYMANVRAITGENKSATRGIIMRAFNTPLFPDVLIASQILAEGVDLQRFCRIVIHHDLCWNPSTLEQRIGRVDRLGSLSERAQRPLHIFEPYLNATTDEKMYRVVKDRERWFQVVMGDDFKLSEATTERRANRVPLPESIIDQLRFDLSLNSPDGV